MEGFWPNLFEPRWKGKADHARKNPHAVPGRRASCRWRSHRADGLSLEIVFGLNVFIDWPFWVMPLNIGNCSTVLPTPFELKPFCFSFKLELC